MAHCIDCKYWHKADKDCNDGITNPVDPDTYEPMEMPFQVLPCNHPNITLFERNPDPRGVSLVDGSDYYAQMYTGPMFGCVNFVPHEK